MVALDGTKIKANAALSANRTQEHIEEEVRKMQQDAEIHAEEDRKRKERVETLNEAEQLAFQYEKTLKEMGDKMDKSQLEPLQKDIDGLKELLKDKEGNYDAIKSAKEALVQKFSKISEEMYKKAAEEYAKQQPQNAPEGGAGDAGDTGEDDAPKKKGKEKIVDAEFKEKGKK